MKKSYIINCTDRDPSTISTTFAKSAAAHPAVKARLQIGSYSCGNYFFYILENQYLTAYVMERGEYDLVIPVFSEKQREQFEGVSEHLLLKQARHIVINDFGMLQRFKSDDRVRLGRLLFQENRDHRYTEYDSEYHGQTKADVLVDALRGMGFHISAVENDMIAKGYMLNLKDIDVYYHFPYRLISTSHICEFAAIGKDIEKKFIPDDECSFQCFHTRVCVEERANHTAYLKVGRSVFDYLSDDWLCPEHLDHVIYTPRW